MRALRLSKTMFIFSKRPAVFENSSLLVDRLFKIQNGCHKTFIFQLAPFLRVPVKKQRLLVIRARSPSLINKERVSSLLKETIE